MLIKSHEGLKNAFMYGWLLAKSLLHICMRGRRVLRRALSPRLESWVLALIPTYSGSRASPSPYLCLPCSACYASIALNMAAHIVGRRLHTEEVWNIHHLGRQWNPPDRRASVC